MLSRENVGEGEHGSAGGMTEGPGKGNKRQRELLKGNSGCCMLGFRNVFGFLARSSSSVGEGDEREKGLLRWLIGICQRRQGAARSFQRGY